MSEHGELIVPDDFSRWIKDIPVDIKRKLSLHDFRRIWDHSKDIIGKQYKPICPTCTYCDGRVIQYCDRCQIKNP
jgi:hypothetical protein